jgi:Intracellular proteinase inhibitor
MSIGARSSDARRIRCCVLPMTTAWLMTAGVRDAVPACGMSTMFDSRTCLGSDSAVTIPGVRAVLVAPATVRMGDSVALRLVLHNETNAPITLPMMTGHGFGFDPLVRDTNGTVVWRRLAGVPLLRDGEVRTILPHRTTEYHATWNVRDLGSRVVRPGTYRVIGRLVADPDSVVVIAPELTLAVLP